MTIQKLEGKTLVQNPPKSPGAVCSKCGLPSETYVSYSRILGTQQLTLCCIKRRSSHEAEASNP